MLHEVAAHGRGRGGPHGQAHVRRGAFLRRAWHAAVRLGRHAHALVQRHHVLPVHAHALRLGSRASATSARSMTVQAGLYRRPQQAVSGALWGAKRNVGGQRDGTRQNGCRIPEQAWIVTLSRIQDIASAM